jgi:hypothetical protein
MQVREAVAACSRALLEPYMSCELDLRVNYNMEGRKREQNKEKGTSRTQDKSSWMES